jgi:NADPH:quinone reductase-like Zn-dependent oxidoreductase
VKVYRLTKPSLDGLQRSEEPDPKPAPNEALVRIRAVSLNYKDLLFVKPPSEGGFELPGPMIPLSDAAGEVIAIGSAVTRVAVGDRVAPINVLNWFEGPIPADAFKHALGFGVDGVLCQLRTVDQNNLVRLPAGLSFEESSTLTIAGVTAWHAVSGVRANQTVMVLGTGGVAMFALQFCRAAGARVFISSSSNAKAERARALGAEETINYRENPDWSVRVRELTGGRGVDHVVENVGGSSLHQSIAATAIGGTIHSIGILDKGLVNPYEIQFKGITLRGIRMGPRSLFEDMNRLIEQHRIRPLVDRVFPFQEARAAYEYLRDARHVGKVVISIE